MATIIYPAVMERGHNSLGVWFPDLPGCVSAGKTEVEARANAREALALHLEGMIEDGETLPVPSSMTTMTELLEAPATLYLFAVDAEAAPGRQPVSVRVNLTLPEPLLARIDRAADGNRSGWIAEAARERLAKEQRKAG
jgi:predicted RNase H-like HicB family nuclease